MADTMYFAFPNGQLRAQSKIRYAPYTRKYTGRRLIVLYHSFQINNIYVEMFPAINKHNY